MKLFLNNLFLYAHYFFHFLLFCCGVVICIKGIDSGVIGIIFPLLHFATYLLQNMYDIKKTNHNINKYMVSSNNINNII